MLLEIEITFTAGRYHGAEWPPSPARLFHALVAGSHHGAHGQVQPDRRDAALLWLERQPPPTILAPEVVENGGHLVNYVPNNDDGLGDNAHIRTDKSLTVKNLLSEGSLVYSWPVEPQEDAEKHADSIGAMASLVTWLGQTTDLARTHGRLVTEPTPAPDSTRQTWIAHLRPGGKWLTPASGFLQMLKERYPQSVSARPPDFTNSHQVEYQTQTTGLISSPPPWHLFVLRNLKGDYLPYHATRLREVSAMVRYAMITQADRPDLKKHFAPDLLARYIYGHQAAGTDSPSSGGHFAVAPLPSLDAPRYRADGRLRHVALIGYGLDSEPARELFDATTRSLHGQPLVDRGHTIGELELVTPFQLSGKTGIIRPLKAKSRCWRSVTPIILSGLLRRGRSPEKGLVRVLKEAGFPEDATESVASFTGPIVPTAARALQYRIQEPYLKTPLRCHAEIIFKQPVSGPLILGRGKFVGFGLMVPWENALFAPMPSVYYCYINKLRHTACTEIHGQAQS